MRQFEAPRRNFKGAAIFWSLPLSFLAGTVLLTSPVVTLAASPDSHSEAASSVGSASDLMQRWRGYALSRITPDFSWASQSVPDTAAPTVLDRLDSQRVQLAVPLDSHAGLALTLAVQDLPLANQPRLQSDRRTDSTPVLGRLNSPFVGSATNTGISRRFGKSGKLDLSVVLAHQRFAAASLDGHDYLVDQPQPGVSALAGASNGSGLELGASDSLGVGLGWYAGYRSRINMDSFQNYRGIYGNPGDLDIPARMQLGLSWQAAQRTWLDAGVERIKYSSIEPFVSTALPRRLLAVLGDGTSPEFSWRDLDVYSLTVGHEFSPRNRVSVRYSTGEQPQPTSPLLARVLKADSADYSLGLSFMHRVDALQWRFMANYAPAEFVLGVPTSARRDNPGSARQLEFESTWSWSF